MTVTRATTPRPRLRDVRPARGRRCVCDAGSQAPSTGIAVTTITVADACRVKGSPTSLAFRPVQPPTTATSLAARPFKLQ